jgi:cytochrome c oxidase assembly protein subunit 15
VNSALRRLALASLVANVAIVVTGGAVRLTGSGLGCPTWPRCTDASYTATREMGLHGAIEFGNRVLSIVVGLAAVAVVLAVLRSRQTTSARRDLLPYAVGVLALVLVQGVIGGISVRVHLDPWVIGAHFLFSMALLALGYTLWRRTRPSATATAVPGPLRTLARLVAAVSFLVLAAGTVVTGSGPHSGDPAAGRNNVDPETATQIHTDLVFLLLGLSVALWFGLRAVGARRPAVRAAAVLVAVEVGQGAIGFVQYFTNLPVLVVGLHMLGACLVWLATLAAVAAVSPRPGRVPPAPRGGPSPAPAEPVIEMRVA